MPFNLSRDIITRDLISVVKDSLQICICMD